MSVSFAPQDWMHSADAYHQKIQELSSLKKNECLVGTSLAHLFFEKIKGWTGLAPDSSDKKLTDRHIAQVFALGVEKQWITNEERQTLRNIKEGLDQTPAVESSFFSKTVKILNKSDFNTESWNSLHHAAADGQLKEAQAMIQINRNLLFQKDSYCRTPLQYAAYFGHLELVKLFTASGADIHETDKRGSMPIHFAADGGHVNIFKYLLSLGADLNAKNNNNTTVLHFATRAGALELVAFLLKQGIDLEAKNKFGRTSFDWAAEEGHFDCCRLLAECGATTQNTDEDGITTLHLATRGNSLELCKFLIDRGADVEAKSKKGRTPLHWAFQKGNLEICKLLLEKGASVHSLDNEGNTPLHEAACNKHFDICRYLIYRGADAEAKNKEGQTPLHMAAHAGSLEICKLLLERGVNSISSDNLGNTPLHAAAYDKHLDICRYLLDCNANLEAKNKEEQTPLHWAAHVGDLEICKLFLEKGAAIDCIDENGLTPLSTALLTKKFEVAEFFVDKGANLYMRDANHPSCLSSILNITGQKSLPFFQKIYKDNQGFYDLSKEYRQRKLLAHLSEIEGKTHFILKKTSNKMKNIALQGWRGTPIYLWKKILKSLSAFLKQFPELMDPESVQLLTEMLQTNIELKHEDYSLNQFLRWESGKSILVKAGFNSHYASLLFWDDQCVLCDRAHSNIKKGTLVSFKFDKTLFNEEIIDDIVNLKDKSAEEFYKYVLDTLPKRLNASGRHLEIETLPLSLQTSSNCAWANSEGVVLAFLTWHALKKNPKMGFANEELAVKKERIKKVVKFARQFVKAYANWKSFLLIETVNRYLKQMPERSKNLDSDWRLLSQIFAKKFPDKRFIDPRLFEMWKKSREKFLKEAPVLSRLAYTAMSFKNFFVA